MMLKILTLIFFIFFAQYVLADAVACNGDVAELAKNTHQFLLRSDNSSSKYLEQLQQLKSHIRNVLSTTGVSDVIGRNSIMSFVKPNAGSTALPVTVNGSIFDLNFDGSIDILVLQHSGVGHKISDHLKSQSMPSKSELNTMLDIWFTPDRDSKLVAGSAKLLPGAIAFQFTDKSGAAVNVSVSDDGAATFTRSKEAGLHICNKAPASKPGSAPAAAR